MWIQTLGFKLPAKWGQNKYKLQLLLKCHYFTITVDRID